MKGLAISYYFENIYQEKCGALSSSSSPLENVYNLKEIHVEW